MEWLDDMRQPSLYLASVCVSVSHYKAQRQQTALKRKQSQASTLLLSGDCLSPLYLCPPVDFI